MRTRLAIVAAALAAASTANAADIAPTYKAPPAPVPVVYNWGGFYLGGNEMALTPRAMLRIAIMMRENGRYDGAEVIPEAWIRESLQPRTRSPFSGLAYGYGWFLSSSGFVLARGYGGQVIAAHPGRRLAVAITSDPTRPARSEGYFGALMDFLDGPVLQIS